MSKDDDERNNADDFLELALLRALALIELDNDPEPIDLRFIDLPDFDKKRWMQ